MLSPVPFDVRFVFPRSGQELWASSGKLKQASPYFKLQLESGLSESSTTAFEHPAIQDSGDAELELDYSDSDDEVGAPVGAQHSRQTQFHTITITSHAFNTYRAVLGWILTGKITFARRGSTATANPSAGGPDGHPLQPSTTTPTTPCPTPAVSAKSVYRLAHLLGFGSLQRQALMVLLLDLTPDNVAAVLFSCTARDYPTVRSHVAKYVARNHAQVMKADTMKAMLELVEAGEVEHGGVVMKAVMEAMAVELALAKPWCRPILGMPQKSRKQTRSRLTSQERMARLSDPARQI